MLGKIQNIRFGLGGYDDAMLGISFTLGSDKECWGTHEFIGTWVSPPSEHANWTIESQTKLWGEMVRHIGSLLNDAKVGDIQKLIGKPIEAIFKDNTLKEWRLLTETI